MIGVIGSGSWATAIIKILLEDKAIKVNWWVRNENVRQEIASHGHNTRHLPSLSLDSARLSLSGDLATTVKNSDLLLLVVPSAYVKETLLSIPIESYRNKQFVSAIKGTIPSCCTTVSHFLEQHLHIPDNDICVVSGPSHAEEVAIEMPTFLTVASHNQALANKTATLFHCSYCHTSVSDDIDGIEQAVLTKNIYAIAAGICQGLGHGDNLNAVLTSAALRELDNHLQKHVAHPGRRIEDYCYLGDLMVTCWSKHSRNRALGIAVANGETPEQVFARTGSVAEGYYSAKNMHSVYQQMNALDEIPIADSVYRILYENSDPLREMENLINNVF